MKFVKFSVVGFLVFGFLLIVSACSPGIEQQAPQVTATISPSPSPSNTPPPTESPSPTFTMAAIMPVQELWFSEHFEEGMPSNWIASPFWENGTSSVLTNQPEQTFYIQGDWADLEIHIRFLRGPEGWSSIGFRYSDDNYYQFSFDQDNFILGRHSAAEYNGHRLTGQKLSVGEGWHDLTVRIAGGHIMVKWDGQTFVDFTDQDPLDSGNIFLQNWDNSLYELDLLEISRPEVAIATAWTGQESSTPTGNSTNPSSDMPPPSPVIVITPASSNVPRGDQPGADTSKADLTVVSGYIDGRGNLWLYLSNKDPSAYHGAVELACTIWYAMSPNPLGIGNSLNQTVILEPGQGTDINTGCTLDESQGRYMDANLIMADYPFDPDLANNSIDLTP